MKGLSLFYKAAYKLASIGLPLYERYLVEEVRKGPIPRHVAIILDGNRRYARKMGLKPWEGHKLGAEKVREVLKWCYEVGVQIVTLYAFSTENFRRTPEEVKALMKLIQEKFLEVTKDPLIHKYKVKVKALGDLSLLPEEVRDAIRTAEEATRKYEDRYLNICVSYGGRKEIVDAVKKVIRDVLNGKISVNSINEQVFEKYLYTAGLPDPDLIIRTSGEERLSGFLLWQSAYSELYFCDTYWPAFRKIDFLRAIRDYQRRERRFGR